MRTLIAIIAGCMTVGALGFISICWSSAFIEMMDGWMRSEKQ